MTALSLDIREVPWEDPAGDALRESQQAEVRALYSGEDTEPGPKPTGDDIALFLVAFDGATPVGCGGLRPIDASHGEIKRMFVVPERRGAGVAEAILGALESAARERGWSRLVLETGLEHLGLPIRLEQQRCGPFVRPMMQEKTSGTILEFGASKTDTICQYICGDGS